MVEAFRRTVGTDAELLYAHPESSDIKADFGAKHVALINVSDTQAEVALGADDVAADDGARWTAEAGKTLSVELEPGEALYAVVATGSQDIDVLVNGR